MPNHQQQQNPKQPLSPGQKAGEGSAGFSEKAGQAAEQMKSTAIERAQEARQFAESNIEGRRTELAARIHRVSDVLRSAGDDLRSEDDAVAQYIEMASERIERAAAYVSSADVQRVSQDVQRFARERPAMFFGGAFLLGLGLARFLKSSDGRQDMYSSDLSMSQMPGASNEMDDAVTLQRTVPVGSDPFAREP